MDRLSKDKIANLVSNIIDQDFGKSYGELGYLTGIKIEGSHVQLDMEVDGPIYWAVNHINQDCINALRPEYPSTTFNIVIKEKSIDNGGREVLPSVKNIICVASGKGGVGKSAVASNLAAAFKEKGCRVGILDGDIYGPSQPTMFGLSKAKLEAIQLPDGKTAAKPTEKYGIHVASMGFLMDSNQAAIVRGPMLAGYFSMLFEQIVWPDLDIMIFDLPPGTGDIQLTLTQKIPLTGAVVVTTPQEIALADVRRSISMFRKVDVEVFGVVENMSYFSPPDMPDKKYAIFGEGGGERIVKEMKTDLIGQLPIVMKMREANDGGMPMVIKYPDTEQADIFRQIASKIASKIRLYNNKISEKELTIEI